MKAHVKTQREIEKALELSEILRVNKIWLYVIGKTIRISKAKLKELYGEVCEFAGRIYEDPEYWLVVDDYVIDEIKLAEGFERENYDEREKISAKIHKEHGKKWRQY